MFTITEDLSSSSSEHPFNPEPEEVGNNSRTLQNILSFLWCSCHKTDFIVSTKRIYQFDIKTLNWSQPQFNSPVMQHCKNPIIFCFYWTLFLVFWTYLFFTPRTPRGLFNSVPWRFVWMFDLRALGSWIFVDYFYCGKKKKFIFPGSEVICYEGPFLHGEDWTHASRFHRLTTTQSLKPVGFRNIKTVFFPQA